MMPYVPVDLLRAMHQDRIGNRWNANDGRGEQPDPLALALAKHQPAAALHAGAAWLARLGRTARVAPRFVVRRPRSSGC